MVTIDSLDIQISSSAQKANKSINALIENIGRLANSLKFDTSNIENIGKNIDLSGISKQAKTISESVGQVGKKVAQSMKPIEKQAKGAQKSISEIAKEFQEKFKNISVKVDFSKPESELKKFQNQAKNAENALTRIMESSTADKQVKSIEKWSIVLAQANNAIGQLQSKLEEDAKLNVEVNTEKVKSADEMIEQMKSHIQQMLARKVIENPIDITELSDEQFDLFQKLKEEAISASKTIGESFSDTGKQITQNISPISDIGQTIKDFPKLSIETEGLEEGEDKLNSFSNQLKNMADLIKRTFTFSAVRDVENWYKLSDSVKNYVKNAQIASGIKIYTDDYKNILSDVERTEVVLKKLEQKKNDLIDKGIGEESKEWKKVSDEISTAEKQLESYIDKKQEMEVRGEDVQFSRGISDQSWIKTMGAVAGEAMSSLRQRIGEIGEAVSQSVGNIPIIGRIAKESAFLGKAAFEGFKSTLSGVAKVAGMTVGAVSKIASAVAKLASGVKSTISKLSSMSKSFIGLKNASKSANTSLGGGLKTILRYGLGIRSLYALVNKLRTAMKEGFKNLAQYSEETNSSLSMVQSSLGALKNSLAVAFSPIVNVIAPYISMLIDMLTRAFNVIGQFFSALTGKALAVQAKKTFSDYAAGVSKAGKAAKKAGDDVQKGIRSFDELKTISIGDDGASGGGGGDSEILPSDMFEAIPIESSVMNFADALKKLVHAEDWEGIGTFIADKFNTGLKKIYDFLNWGNIGPKITNFVNAFTEAFNGLVDGFEWDTLGRTIGAGINTAVNTLNLLIEGIDWVNIGNGLANSINGLVNEVDFTNLGTLIGNKFMILPRILLGVVSNLEWGEIGTQIGNALNGVVGSIKLSEIGELLGKGLTGIFEAAINFSATFDWIGLGTNIYEGINSFFSNTDWATVGKGISDFVLGLLDSLIVAIEGTDWKQIGEGIVDLIAGIDWIGLAGRLAVGLLDVVVSAFDLIWGAAAELSGKLSDWFGEIGWDGVAGFFKGLQEELSAKLELLKTLFDDYILRPIKDFFGIHSPSTLMAQLGKFLIEGLINGMKSLFGGIKSVWNEIASIFESAKAVISNIIGGIANIIDGVISTIRSAIQAIKDFFSESSKVGSVSTAAKGAASAISANSGISRTVSASYSVADVPQLATGAVFRGGNPFLAIVNDQKRGQTNVETPLKVIQEALREELKDYTQKYTYNANYDYAPSLADMYGEYAKSTVEYSAQYNGEIGYGTNRSEEDMIREIRKQNQLLREQNRLLEAIYRKPTMEIGDVSNALVSYSMYAGGNMRGGSMSRLAVAEELYK